MAVRHPWTGELAAVMPLEARVMPVGAHSRVQTMPPGRMAQPQGGALMPAPRMPLLTTLHPPVHQPVETEGTMIGRTPDHGGIWAAVMAIMASACPPSVIDEIEYSFTHVSNCDIPLVCRFSADVVKSVVSLAVVFPPQEALAGVPAAVISWIVRHGGRGQSSWPHLCAPLE